MADDWMPGAERVPGAHQGGQLIGGPPRATWHITWDHLDPRPTFDNVRDYLVKVNYEPTILWDPETGRFAEFLAASRSAYAVRNLKGGVETNRLGDVHVQIEVFFSPGYNGLAVFTDGPLVGLDQLMAWLDDLGVPRVAAGDFTNPTRDPNTWLTHPGHYGHSMVPENDHTDPGPIDIARILGATPAPAPLPQPSPEDDDMNGRAIIHDSQGHTWIFRRGGNGMIYFSRDGGSGGNRIEGSSIGSAPSAVEVNGVLIVGGKGSTDDRFWAARHNVTDPPDKWTWGAEDT